MVQVNILFVQREVVLERVAEWWWLAFSVEALSGSGRGLGDRHITAVSDAVLSGNGPWLVSASSSKKLPLGPSNDSWRRTGAEANLNGERIIRMIDVIAGTSSRYGSSSRCS